MIESLKEKILKLSDGSILEINDGKVMRQTSGNKHGKVLKDVCVLYEEFYGSEEEKIIYNTLEAKNILFYNREFYNSIGFRTRSYHKLQFEYKDYDIIFFAKKISKDELYFDYEIKHLNDSNNVNIDTILEKINTDEIYNIFKIFKRLVFKKEKNFKFLLYQETYTDKGELKIKKLKRKKDEAI